MTLPTPSRRPGLNPAWQRGPRRLVTIAKDPMAADPGCAMIGNVEKRWKGIVYLAAGTCLTLSACEGDTSNSGTGGGCAFVATWRGVTYTDPMLHPDGRDVRPPHKAGAFLGTGTTPKCDDGNTAAGTVRLFAVPGVRSRVAVTTADAQYLGVAEDSPIPRRLIDN